MAGVCLSSAAMAQNQAVPTDAPSPFTPVLTSPTPGTGSYLALGDQVGGVIDVTTPSGDSGIQGVEPAYGYFYVSGSNNSATPIGAIYQFTTAGALVNSFMQNQPGTGVGSQFGHRDLASDGDGIRFNLNPTGGRLWGGQEQSHWVQYDLDAFGGLNAGTVMPTVSGIGTMRGLAYLGVPAGTTIDQFVTFTTDRLVEFNAAGFNLGQWIIPAGTPMDRYNGLAVNPTNPNLVWGLSPISFTCSAGNPGNNSQMRIIELDRSLGYAKTGLEFCGALPGEGGGLGIFDGGCAGINPGSFTFAAVQIGSPIDVIGLYDTGIPTAGTPGTAFCTPKLGACGNARMQVSGNSSATATSGFIVCYGPTRGCRAGLVLYSNQGTAAPTPFGGPGNGMLCMPAAGLRRAGPIDSGGTPGGCDGFMAMDFNAFAQGMHAAVGCNPAAGQNNAPNFLRVPGTTVWAQGWGRDSVATGQVLSNGRTWTVGP